MAAENNSNKRAMLDFNTHITVLVGEEKRSFVVHEGIITNHSRFFRAACSGNFKESKDRIVPLPEVEPDLFSIYLQHIYTGQVVVLSPADAQDDRSGSMRYNGLAQMYRLGDQLDDIRLRNDTLDHILELEPTVECYPGPEAINIAYTEVPETSLLRKLIRDFYTEHVSAKWLEEYRHGLPADFIFDIACARGGKPKHGVHPGKMPQCTYHEHNDEAPKCAARD